MSRLSRPKQDYLSVWQQLTSWLHETVNPTPSTPDLDSLTQGPEQLTQGCHAFC